MTRLLSTFALIGALTLPSLSFARHRSGPQDHLIRKAHQLQELTEHLYYEARGLRHCGYHRVDHRVLRVLSNLKRQAHRLTWRIEANPYNLRSSYRAFSAFKQEFYAANYLLSHYYQPGHMAHTLNSLRGQVRWFHKFYLRRGFGPRHGYPDQHHWGKRRGYGW